MKILLCFDEHNLKSIKKQLISYSFSVDSETDIKKALWRTKHNYYDFFLIKKNNNDSAFIKILAEIKKRKSHLSFIVFSEKNDLDFKIEVFKVGADDFILMPFSITELVYRMKAIKRRINDQKKNELNFLNFRLDPDNFRLFKGKQQVELRKKEFDLLNFFMQNPCKVLNRTFILEQVWDMNADPFTNTVDVHVKNLRKKIGDNKGNIIKTIYGRGYEFKV